MFHRIYESMALGMHPASLYPRRSRVAPGREVARSLYDIAQIAVPVGFEAV
jgi:hypothetical protein